MSSKNKVASGTSSGQNSSVPESHVNGERESNDYYDNYLWLGPRGNGGTWPASSVFCLVIIASVCGWLLPS